MKFRATDAALIFPYLYAGDIATVSRAYGPAVTPHAFVFEGARKLRYVGAIDDSKDWEFLSWMSLLVSWHGAPVPMDEGSGSKRANVEFRKEDSPELRRRMVRLIQEWWKEHGADHHQWWRVWSESCR